MATTEEFVSKAMGDLSSLMTVLMASIGDKLGLFRALASSPATAADLAKRANVNERYAREWLRGMTCAGYLEHDERTDVFSLPADHQPVLAHENGPMFFGGIYQQCFGVVEHLPRIAESFRRGGGVPASAYGDDFWCGLSRFTNAWFENLLTQSWLPAVPDALGKLENGCFVADVGCGHGRAAIKLAQSFPKSRIVGYDFLTKNIEMARALARDAGVDDRVRFEQVDASRGLPATYDLITTFDVVHDAPDPKGMLTAIRKALNATGIYLCLDINCSDRLEQMIGPLGAMFHGISLMYCMTTSLAAGGVGLGTCGLHEKKLGELARESGFKSVRRAPIDNPFNCLYELRI